MKIRNLAGFIIALAVLVVGFPACNEKKKEITDNKVSFGVITDVHQDLQPDARERLQAFIDSAKVVNPDFIVQLGDLSHGTTTDSILEIWNRYPGKNYHVLGNHDSDNLPKDSIIKKQNMPGRYYSYDIGGMHFIVLDLNYFIQKGEHIDFGLGNNYPIPSDSKNLISPPQMLWLEEDLASTGKPTIVFSHQGIGDTFPDWVSPSNKKIREIFAKANSGGEKKVIACFAGDQHVDTYEEIEGVHYFQINSASYFWIEESAVFSNGHMAEYKDPLFAFVTVDLNNRTIEVKGVNSVFLEPAPSSENYSTPQKLSASVTSRKVNF
ncbi:MAG TPA: hypothetical protein DIT04_05780 [Dysgonomonas sp.]|nr:hypothetical protein [Dysgonomonas sp.]